MLNIDEIFSRKNCIAVAEQYFESIGKELDDQMREFVLAINEIEKKAYKRGFKAGMRAAQVDNN